MLSFSWILEWISYQFLTENAETWVQFFQPIFGQGFFLKFSWKLAKIFGRIGLNSNELFNSGTRCIKLGKTGTFLLVFSVFLIEMFNQFDSDHSLRQKNYEKWVKFDTSLAIFANHLGWISSWMQKKNESTEQKWRWISVTKMINVCLNIVKGMSIPLNLVL